MESHYNHPGIAVTVSSGDNGYGVEFPAASRYVTAVGGTSLSRAANARGFSETAWTGAGSGCSSYVAMPAGQADGATCSTRSVADVSAVADPNTGVAVYDSYGSSGGANWYVFGGTSVAAPIIGAVYALAGNTASINAGSYPYSHTSSLFDVISGSNGRCTTSGRRTAPTSARRGPASMARRASGRRTGSAPSRNTGGRALRWGPVVGPALGPRSSGDRASVS